MRGRSRHLMLISESTTFEDIKRNAIETFAAELEREFPIRSELEAFLEYALEYSKNEKRDRLE